MKSWLRDLLSAYLLCWMQVTQRLAPLRLPQGGGLQGCWTGRFFLRCPPVIFKPGWEEETLFEKQPTTQAEHPSPDQQTVLEVELPQTQRPKPRSGPLLPSSGTKGTGTSHPPASPTWLKEKGIEEIYEQDQNTQPTHVKML